METIEGVETYADTDRAVAGMMTTPTGKSVLDSGSAYGRHWEEHIGKAVEDFRSEPAVEVDFSYGEPAVSVDLFHYMTNWLDYRTDFDRAFQEWVEKTTSRRESWIQVMERFTAELGRFGVVTDAIDGAADPITENTYNHESVLTQVLQHHGFYAEVPAFRLDGVDFPAIDGTFFLIQVHGGCDVRGGYTRPRAFQTHDPYQMYCTADCTIYDQSGNHWGSDDGYHFYDRGSTRGEQLEEYEFVRVEDLSDRAVTTGDDTGDAWDYAEETGDYTAAARIIAGLDEPGQHDDYCAWVAARREVVVCYPDGSALSPKSGTKLEGGM